MTRPSKPTTAFRPFVFLAGEYNTTMPVVFEFDNWRHTMLAVELIAEEGKVRHPKFGIYIEGVIYFARTEDFRLEKHNLKVLADTGLPCWPDPKILMGLSDRHMTMLQCEKAGLLTDPMWSMDAPVDCWGLKDKPDFSKKLVLKVGQAHQGQDKHLIESEADFVKLIDTAEKEGGTLEYFYDGLSTRVLFIGDKHFGVQYQNPNSWVKNSVGCDYSDWEIPEDVLEHAKRARKHFGLEVAGVDYVISKDKFHFLEINQFPGLGVNEESVKVAREFLREKIRMVESMRKAP